MKIQRLIISLILVFFTVACTSIKSNENISLEKILGRKQVVINYDSGRYKAVKLDNIIIDSGKIYYIKEGRYVLSYVEEAFINGYIDFSWKGSKGASNNKDRKIPMRKSIDIQDDMEINLENHMIQINFSGTINSSKKF
ncbi:hypothetical protein [uncultured Fusobacterium sp.]|uniref:hypothetical protein n=1 Tax=uncultured Fusobacterium sp. TaxID=159267 RepID=UPI0025F6DD95|nr:hypothetical protein [uncultured Fusobacterium sp.]